MERKHKRAIILFMLIIILTRMSSNFAENIYNMEIIQYLYPKFIVSQTFKTEIIYIYIMYKSRKN